MPVPCTHPTMLPIGIFETLSRALVMEPKINSTRNTPVNLQALYEQHLAVVLMEDDEPIGFIAAWPVAQGFAEIGSVWIHPAHRGRGLSHQIYDAIPLLRGVQAVVAFGVTTNAISVHVGERVGLTIVDDWDTPVPRHLSCGNCEHVAPLEQPMCSRRGVSCWLRVIKRT